MKNNRSFGGISLLFDKNNIKTLRTCSPSSSSLFKIVQRNQDNKSYLIHPRLKPLIPEKSGRNFDPDQLVISGDFESLQVRLREIKTYGR